MIGGLVEELNISKSMLHQWVRQYQELKNKPLDNMDQVRELEAQKEKSCQFQEKDNKIAVVKEGLAIVKKQCTSSDNPLHVSKERLLQVADRKKYITS